LAVTNYRFRSAYVVEALNVQARTRAKERATGEVVVHPETHAAFGIHPVTVAEFARRNAAVLRGDVAA
jgi:hypothetical protein